MKRSYEELELEIIRFKSEDVITASNLDSVDDGQERIAVGPENG